MGSHSPTLLAQWNQTGGSPRFLFELVETWNDMLPGSVVWSFNAAATNADVYRALKVPAMEVKTYTRSRFGILLGTPRLVQLAFNLLRFARAHSVGTYISAMPNIFQSIVAPIAIPRSITYVTCIHDAQTHPGDRDNFLYELLLRLELRRADKIVVFSDAVAGQVLKRLPGREHDIIQTFHPAWNNRETAHAWTRTLEGDRPIILGFFGRLFPYKGLELLLNAIRILRERGLDVLLEVHGQGPDGELEKTATDIPGTWKVDWIAEEDVEHVVSGFTILALPYIEASQSGVFAQAMALGVPSVATPVGGLRQQMESTGAGIVATDVSAAAFADAVERLVNDPALYESLSVSALRASKETHNWSGVVNDILAGLEGSRSRPHNDTSFFL